MTGKTGRADIHEHPEASLILNIDLNRGLVAALLIVAAIVVVALLVRGPAPAAAAGEAVSAATDNMRRYYLGGPVMANVAISSCASGYHFASLWEILDPSNLVYASPGLDAPDSGWGPPTTWAGWVRTGFTSNVSDTAGQGNCGAWQSIDGADSGTTARLTSSWSTGGELHVWDVDTQSCGTPAHIWCVED